MNKKLFLILFFIFLIVTGYIYYNYKKNEIVKNSDNEIKENKKDINNISEEIIKEDDVVNVEKIILKGEETLRKDVITKNSENMDKKIKQETEKEEIKESYVVSFDYDGGTIEKKNKLVTYGETYGFLPDAKKEGYTFIGWYNENGQKIYENSKVTERVNQTLYAKYKINNYVIKFDYNYLENNLYKNILKNSSYNLSYELMNDELFFNQSVLKFKLEENIIKYKEDIKLEKGKTYTYSVYLKSDIEREIEIGFNDEFEKVKINEYFNRFTKTFVANDKDYNEFIFKFNDEVTKNNYLEIYDLSISEGELNIKEEEKSYNEKIETKEVPVREGYTFDGWYTDLSLKEKANIVNDNNIYFAKWNANIYTLKLDIDGKISEIKGGFNTLKKIDIPELNYKVIYDEPKKEVVVKRNFKGWINENNEYLKDYYIFTKDSNFKAIFEDNETIQLEYINKENNICHWNTKKNDSGTKYDSGALLNINNDIKLYSVCNPIIKFERPINHGIVTSEYGNRIHPITGENKFHNGIDITGNDKNIYPVLPGVVAQTGNNSSMGNYIIIYHTYNNQNYTSAYYHLENKNVRKNQKVNQSTVIGKMGQTGVATGVHLHLTMYKGHLDIEDSTIIDPKNIIDFPNSWDSKAY